jgi:lipopolysaccharide export LptBFGC system permease protein LptF
VPAGVITLILLAILVALIFVPVAADVNRGQMIQTFGGFFLAAFGYLFGSVSGKRG